MFNDEENNYEVEEGVYDVEVDPSVIEKKKELKSKKELDLKIKKAIVIVGSIFIGLIVFLISNALFGEKKVVTTTPQKTEISLTDSRVANLYQYVTYGINNKRNDKFVTNKSVKLNDFNTSDKFFYALQFVTKNDFKETGKTETDYNLKVYSIANSKIKEYMVKFFGDEVKYSKKKTISYTFDFQIDNGSYVDLKYDEERDAFLTTFGNTNTEITASPLVDDYYTKLSNAYIDTNTDIVIEEDIIYTELTQHTDASGNPIDQYDLKVYQDYSHTLLIAERLNTTAIEITTTPVDIESYISKANKVTYRFKRADNGNYYFDSSSILN